MRATSTRCCAATFEGNVTYNQTGVWTFSSNGNITVSIGGVPSSGTYSVNGDILIWDFGFGQITNKILTLTETELSISAGDRDRVYNLKR